MKSLKNNTLVVDDVILNYYEEGCGDTIILLHGNGMNSLKFYKMFTYFAKTHRTIAIDLRAQGLSSLGTKEFSLELFADDIIGFCKIKNLKDVTIIGYSDGANIALLMAKKNAILIKNLILICGNYTVSGLFAWFRILLEFYKLLLRVIGKLFYKKSKKIYKKTSNRISLLNLMLCDIGIYEPDLQKIQINTLVMCSTKDVVHRKHSLILNSNIKNSKFKLINHCNHESIIRKKKVFYAIDEFLAGNTSNSSDK